MVIINVLAKSRTGNLEFERCRTSWNSNAPATATDENDKRNSKHAEEYSTPSKEASKPISINKQTPKYKSLSTPFKPEMQPIRS